LARKPGIDATTKLKSSAFSMRIIESPATVPNRPQKSVAHLARRSRCASDVLGDFKSLHIDDPVDLEVVRVVAAQRARRQP
jgi:hypothetical protein